MAGSPFGIHQNQFWRLPPSQLFSRRLHHQGLGGNLIKAGAAHHGTSNILVAEARALRDGVRAVVDSGFKRVLIEGDNSIVIQALQGRITVPWQIAGLTHDVSIYLSQLDHVSISHIYREANMAADWLSKAGHSLASPTVWYHPPSLELQAILYSDVMGSSLERRGV